MTIPTEEKLSILWPELDSLQETWIRTKQYSEIALVSHQALQAIEAEKKAEMRYHHPLDTTAPFFRAYMLCDTLELISKALERWIYASARLWFLREQNPEQNQHYQELHENTIAQYHRILWMQLRLQDEAMSFFKEHGIVLRFHIVDQALDFTAQEPRVLK